MIPHTGIILKLFVRNAQIHRVWIAFPDMAMGFRVLFELIWRDYFRFLSAKYGNSIFHLGKYVVSHHIMKHASF